MKKTLLTASIVLLLLMPFLLGGCSGNSGPEGFAVYLTKDDILVSQMDVLSHADIAGEPVFSSKDIVAYDWDTHEIGLTAAAFQRIDALQVPTTGTTFVVCVDGSPVYWGAFWTPLSSQSFGGIIIMVPPFPTGELGDNSIRIDTGYPTPFFANGEDPRSDRRIREALQEAGKLK